MAGSSRLDRVVEESSNVENRQLYSTVEYFHEVLHDLNLERLREIREAICP